MGMIMKFGYMIEFLLTIIIPKEAWVEALEQEPEAQQVLAYLEDFWA